VAGRPKAIHVLVPGCLAAAYRPYHRFRKHQRLKSITLRGGIMYLKAGDTYFNGIF
jgi:hypothetical protein